MKSFKFIITTCSLAGKLHNYGIPKEYFDYVIIDEAG